MGSSPISGTTAYFAGECKSYRKRPSSPLRYKPHFGHQGQELGVQKNIVAKYTFDQIKRNVAEIANRDSYTREFIFELMAAYGRSAASIAQLKSGAIDKSTDENALLQKGVVFVKFFPTGTQLEPEVEAMDMDLLSGRYEPRYLIATDLHHIVAKDTVKRTTLDIEIKNLDNEVAFFYGWTGNEINEGSADESVADRRAADKMKDLYDEIERENIDNFRARPTEFRHDLNVFFSRLLFCFFAEDTGLFQPKQFVNAIKEFTEADGSDLHIFFKDLFRSLDSKDKVGMTTPYSDFPYVGGSLFNANAHEIMIPKFSPNAWHILTLCAKLDWSGVNPDIFGTIFQGIVDETRRDENGMDYTSVPNINRVIDPLFMDELHEEFDKAFDNEKKLYALWNRISKIKIFDPACGSGNFLIISYKKLRDLEHDIIRRISELMEERGIKGGLGGYALASQIKLDHFFGIELEDFPRELAVLSMYIAAHQMNIEFEKEFGKKLSILPLVDMPTIYCDNSVRRDWNSVCNNNGDEEIYVIGNPPYKGSKKQTPSMKSDFVAYFSGEDYSGNLDYIALWFIKGARYISGTKAKLAFVSTNSVCQGEHVGLMFPKIFEQGVEISFAWTSFKWSNNAKDNAGVTVIIMGLANASKPKKLLFTDGLQENVNNISPYLTDGPNTIITKLTNPLCQDFPPMVFGSQALDKGNLTLSPAEYDEICSKSPAAERFIKKFVGSEELINGKMRYCIWVEDADAAEAREIPELNDRFEQNREFRQDPKNSSSTRKMTDKPYKFASSRYEHKKSLVVPRVSSEHRAYIPMGIVDEDTVVPDSAQFIVDPEPWLLAVLESKMHMAWIKAVCGKLETRYRYSSTLGYNTFPCPLLNEAQKEKLSQSARNILFARANHPELTLADLYDPDKMPDDLREAHEANDILVDKLYRPTPFSNDEARLATLFKLYEEMVARSQ